MRGVSDDTLQIYMWLVKLVQVNFVSSGGGDFTEVDTLIFGFKLT